jgi:hypothetical protein
MVRHVNHQSNPLAHVWNSKLFISSSKAVQTHQPRSKDRTTSSTQAKYKTQPNPPPTQHRKHLTPSQKKEKIYTAPKHSPLLFLPLPSTSPKTHFLTYGLTRLRHLSNLSRRLHETQSCRPNQDLRPRIPPLLPLNMALLLQELPPLPHPTPQKRNLRSDPRGTIRSTEETPRSAACIFDKRRVRELVEPGYARHDTGGKSRGDRRAWVQGLEESVGSWEREVGGECVDGGVL